MKFTLEATPLDIVHHTDVQIEVRCEVYDIHRQHATAIQALFAQHPLSKCSLGLSALSPP